MMDIVHIRAKNKQLVFINMQYCVHIKCVYISFFQVFVAEQVPQKQNLRKKVQEMYQGVQSESAPIRKGMDMQAGSGRSSVAVQSQQSFSQVHGQHCNWDGPSEFPLMVGRGLDLCTVLCVCVSVCVYVLVACCCCYCC